MRIIEGIKQTRFVTFPRSGHHALKHVLEAYFGDRFHWVDSHVDETWCIANKPEWCNGEKNHDFDLNVPVLDELIHIIQIRDPIFAIAGWKAMHQREGMIQSDWRPWCVDRLKWYATWCEKWLYTDVPNRLVVPYQHLLDDPVRVCTKVIEFMLEDPKEIHHDRLRSIVLHKLRICSQPRQHVPFDYL